jgi:hypothetical protein
MYLQHNGVAIGTPFTPVLSDIFMAPRETTLIEALNKIGVSEWHRCVDDTFRLVDSTVKVKDILSILKIFHPSTRLIMKMKAIILLYFSM